tara:strand:- start:4887 stop:5174 length:288 start_codon:yes stop_codon:yes gene_type:complete
MDINKKLGANLKKRRDDLGFSQKSFGEKVGLSRASIANVERGEQAVNVEQLYKFADALRISPAELLPKSDDSSLREFPKQTRLWIDSVLKEAENA